MVPFLDAGNIYTGGTPDFSGLRYGTGIGLRYYSNFGPIRVDVGTPLNPQPGDGAARGLRLAGTGVLKKADRRWAAGLIGALVALAAAGSC